MRKNLIALSALVGASLMGAAPALAHVAVDATDTSKGAEVSTLTFRVPNEEDGASTTQVDVFFPDNAKFSFAATQPIPGWTATGDKTKVSWTGGRIGPGQFQEFKVEVGPLPKSGSLLFKAIQTYDNGDVVRWIDVTPASGEEPEHPAPELTLTAASGAEHASSASDALADAKDKDSTARALAIAAVLISVLAVGVAAARGRKAASGS